MIKKILLISLATSSLLLASEVTQDQVKLQADITAAKAEKSAADSKLKALEAQLPQDQSIKTNVKLGYMKTDGNTDTETFSLDGSFKKAWGKNSGSITFDAQYGNAENVVTKNKYFVELEYGYLFTGSLTANMVVGYKNDKFSSYSYQTYVGPGIKYGALSSSRQKLDIEASLLYSSDNLQGQYEAAQPDFVENYGSYKAKALYELNILDNLKFNQELSYRASFDDSQNYFIFSKSELSSKISDIFSAGVAYKIDYTNHVSTNIKKRDNTLSAFLSLAY